jgi:alpha-beta hydrolase superfamily lysophospholipase
MHFTIPSHEDLPIRGDFSVPERARALVVVAHGFKGFKDWGFFPWLADSLCRHGIVVCRFNMSRSGIGENPEAFDRLDLFADDTYSTQVADLLAVVRYAQERHPHLPTFLLGHSRGGGVALLAAPLVPRLRGIVTWSAISRVDRWDEPTIRDWRERGFLDVMNARTKQVMRMSPAILDDYDAHREHLNVLDAAALLRVPLLVLHGERDDSVPVAEARAIAERATDASLCVIRNASHTYNAIHPLVHVPFALTLAAEVSAHFVNAFA